MKCLYSPHCQQEAPKIGFEKVDVSGNSTSYRELVAHRWGDILLNSLSLLVLVPFSVGSELVRRPGFVL